MTPSMMLRIKDDHFLVTYAGEIKQRAQEKQGHFFQKKRWAQDGMKPLSVGLFFPMQAALNGFFPTGNEMGSGGIVHLRLK